jgi:hypothetical protein
MLTRKLERTLDEEEQEDISTEAYLDELQHKYLAYTHCTVVEFTPEEGNVGLPEAIAKALLSGQKVTFGDEKLPNLHSAGISDISTYIVPSIRTSPPPPKPTEEPNKKNTRFQKGQYVVYARDQTIVKVTNVHLDDELIQYLLGTIS